MQEVIGTVSYVGFSVNPNMLDKKGNPIQGLDVTFKDANGSNFYFKVSNVMPKIEGNSERFDGSRLAKVLKALGRFSDVARVFNGAVIREGETKKMMQLKNLLSGSQVILSVEKKTVKDIKSLATIPPNQVQSIGQQAIPQATFSGFDGVATSQAPQRRAQRRGLNG